MKIVLTGINKGCYSTGAGIDKLYVFDYNDINTKTVDITTKIHLDGFVLASGKKGVTFELPLNTASLVATAQISETRFFENVLTIKFSEISALLRGQIMSLAKGDSFIVVKTNAGKLLCLGLFFPVKVTDVTMNTGMQLGDAIGFDLTLTDYSSTKPVEFDETAIGALITTFIK